MKSRFKLHAALSFSVIIALGSVLTACGNNSNNTGKETTASPAASQQTAQVPLKLKFWTPLNSNVSPVVKSLSEVLAVQEWEKKANVKFDFIHPVTTSSNDTKQQYGIMMASNDLPDVLAWDWSVVSGGAPQMYKDGSIIKLNDLIDKSAPNLKKVLQDNPSVAKQLKSDNGDILVFPNLNLGQNKAFSGLMVRQDWLDEFGLQMPETIDEWENVLRTFKQKKGSAPLVTTKSNLFGGQNDWMTFMGAYGINSNFYVKDGKVRYPVTETAYKEYMKRMQAWYKEGLIDPDYATDDQKTIDAKIVSGKAGVFYGFIGGTMGKYLPALQQSNAKAALSAAPYPVLKKGDTPMFVDTSYEYANWGAVITKSNKNPEQTIKALDYLFSKEGAMLKNFGVEGITYNLVNGYPKYTDLILNNPDKLPIGQAMGKYMIANYSLIGPSDDRYNEQYYVFAAQKEALKTYNKYAAASLKQKLPPSSMTTDEASEYSKIVADITTYHNELSTKIILGSKPLDSVDEMAAQIKKMKIDRAIEIQQAAYDRFNARK